MTDPKTRALELVDELEHEAMGSDSYDSGTAIALRLAITQIPTISWQPIQTAPIGNVRLLVQDSSGRHVVDAFFRNHSAGWRLADDGRKLPAYLRPIAWKPADSTELPAELEGKAGQLEHVRRDP